MGSFARDTAVERVGEGRYRCDLDHSWDLVAVPQGGMIVAIALRAAEEEIGDPAQTLRTCTTVFAGQVTAGALSVEVDVLRRGRSATQVRALVRNDGAASGATVVAVFGSARRGPSFVDIRPPDVPSPADCTSYWDDPPPDVEFGTSLPFWTQVEGRNALGHPPWWEHEAGCSDVATWLRLVERPSMPDGTLDPLALVLLADRMPGCISEMLGHSDDKWFAPSADLTVHLFRPLRSEWVLAHDRARWADDGWASAESTLWDEDGTVVAYATQMMLFSY